MAIYHYHAQIIKRANGHRATTAAAYRAGEKIGKDDYTRKRGIDYKAILAPENAPDWAKDRARLWQAVEDAEKRADAQLCREINLALPIELTAEEQKDLLHAFANECFVQHGMVADLAIHHQATQNPHAHIMLTMREIDQNGFGKKNRDWNKKEFLGAARKKWADLANTFLERAGHETRIDHRTLEEQGITDRVPTVHEGKTVTTMKRQGKQSDIADMNTIKKEMGAVKKSLKEQQAEIDELEQAHAELEARERQEAALDSLSKTLPCASTLQEKWKTPYLDYIAKHGATEQNWAFVLERAEFDISENGRKEISAVRNSFYQNMRPYNLTGHETNRLLDIAIDEYKLHAERFSNNEHAILSAAKIVGKELEAKAKSRGLSR